MNSSKISLVLTGSKEPDEHLDSEFVFLAQFIRFCYKLVPVCDQPKCVAWLERLLSPARDGTPKIVRNSILAQLLLAMQSGQISGPFLQKPPRGPLKSWFDEKIDVTEPSWIDIIVDAPCLDDEDADERTYIATQTDPDNDASYAYVAVSTDEEEHWLDSMGMTQSALRSRRETRRGTLPGPACERPTAGVRNHHFPCAQACQSCSSVNPSPEAVKSPCRQDMPSHHQKRHGKGIIIEDDMISCPEDKNPLINFYDELLALVDCFQRTGCCSEDSYIRQLLQRVKDQAADPAVLEMGPEELRSELIHRLKTKLLTRREQAKQNRCRNPCLNENFDSFPDDHDQCAPLDLDLTLDEEIWESAARKELSPTNVKLLESVYPKVLVNRFVSSLIRERTSLISRMRAEHDVLVTSLGNDLQKDIRESLDRFREARASWILLLRATQELEHIGHHEYSNNSSDSESGIAIRETIREVRDAMVALDEEGRRGANLASQLVSEHQDLYATERDGARRAQRLLAHNDTLRSSLRQAQAQYAERQGRIQEIRQQLESSRPSMSITPSSIPASRSNLSKDRSSMAMPKSRVVVAQSNQQPSISDSSAAVARSSVPTAQSSVHVAQSSATTALSSEPVVHMSSRMARSNETIAQHGMTVEVSNATMAQSSGLIAQPNETREDSSATMR